MLLRTFIQNHTLESGVKETEKGNELALTLNMANGLIYTWSFIQRPLECLDALYIEKGTIK